MTHQSILPESIHSVPVEKQETLLYLAMKDVVAKHICMEFNPTHQPQMCQDGAMEYSRELLSTWMLFLEFHDAIREGDGERVFWWWKFLFLIFMLAGRIKYTVEAFHFMCQRCFLCSERWVKQLLYSQFVNIRVMPHHTIPADLHMEHLNHAVKTAVSHSNAVRIERSIIRAGKCIWQLNLAMDKFDEASSLSSPSGKTHKVC